MISRKSTENLVLLTILEMIGIILLEVVLWMFVLIGFFPPTVAVVSEGEILLQINTDFIVIAGLMFVLVASFWLALLAEVFGIIEITQIKINF